MKELRREYAKFYQDELAHIITAHNRLVSADIPDGDLQEHYKQAMLQSVKDATSELYHTTSLIRLRARLRACSFILKQIL